MNNNLSNELQTLDDTCKPILINSTNTRANSHERARAVRRQTIMVILGNLGVMSIGMGLGLPTTTQKPLTDPNELVHLSSEQYSWFASINLLVAPLGGLLSGIFLDRLGRKNTMYIENILGLISWLLMALASQSSVEALFYQLLISRFIIGVNCGLASAPTGVYSAEISTPEIRGRLILGTSISVASGITFIYTLGYFLRDDWRLIAIICSIFQFVALLCIIPMPESPNWLISKGRLSEARQSLNYFRGYEKEFVITQPEILSEFNLLQKNIQSVEGVQKPSFLKSLRLPEVYKPLFILTSLFSFQQLTGVIIVIIYAIDISTDAGVTIDPFMCAILIGLSRLLTTFFMGYILEKWGRRVSGMISALGMGVSMILLTFHKQSWLVNIPFLAVSAILSFILHSTIGLYTLPYLLISELFPQHVRGAASGLTVIFGTLVSFLCTKIYPTIRDLIGNEYCFLIFAIFSFISLVFIYFALPETRGKTLLEIEDNFRKSKKLMKKSNQNE